MKKGNTTYLNDILSAIKRIEEYAKDLTYDVFEEDLMRQDAVIRQLEIIGEAAHKLPLDFIAQNTEIPLSEAVRMRNFLIHGYADIDLPTVWKTVQEDLPFLKKEIENYLH